MSRNSYTLPSVECFAHYRSISPKESFFLSIRVNNRDKNRLHKFHSSYPILSMFLQFADYLFPFLALSALHLANLLSIRIFCNSSIAYLTRFCVEYLINKFRYRETVFTRAHRMKFVQPNRRSKHSNDYYSRSCISFNVSVRKFIKRSTTWGTNYQVLINTKDSCVISSKIR